MSKQQTLFKPPNIEQLTDAKFDGKTFDAKWDSRRLTGQLKGVYSIMKDGRWYTIREIENITNYPGGSISARIRDFRKKKYGEHEVNLRRRGKAEAGYWEYQLIVNTYEKR